MSDFYFDEDHGVAYKVNPIAIAVVHGGDGSCPKELLVHTDVKVTNLKKQKVRRTLSKLYPSDKYDLDAARKVFLDTMLSRFINGAKRISEQEYDQINSKYEM